MSDIETVRNVGNELKINITILFVILHEILNGLHSKSDFFDSKISQGNEGLYQHFITIYERTDQVICASKDLSDFEKLSLRVEIAAIKSAIEREKNETDFILAHLDNGYF